MTSKHAKNRIAEYVTENKEKIYRLAFSYVKNAEDALDIVQESICKAISSGDSMKNPEYIKTWFYRIVVNTSLDFLRKRKRVHLAGEEELAGLDPGTVDKYVDIDLQSALDRLPDNCRTVIVLRYFEDLRIDEIADVLDENINTVKTRLYKSLRLLRIEMDEHEEVL